MPKKSEISRSRHVETIEKETVTISVSLLEKLVKEYVDKHVKMLDGHSVQINWDDQGQGGLCGVNVVLTKVTFDNIDNVDEH